MPKFSAADGTQLYYEDDGEGLPLLCLAGLTRTTGDFAYLAPHLPPLRRIAMDYRGRGRSDWADPASYTLMQEAADAMALMDHLGIDTFALLGTSRGGLIGMILASVAHDRLLGLCLNDIGPVIEEAGMETIRGYLGIRPRQKTHAEAAAMRAELLPGFTDVPASRWQEEVRLHYREVQDGLDITYDPRLRDAVLGAAEGAPPDVWDLFEAANGLPLALLRGANSNLLSYETAQEMARRRPDMHWAEVPGRGHVPFLDEPESLKCILDWLGDLP